MYSVALNDMIRHMKLEICTKELDNSGIKISDPDINRPALQLAGFFDHFDSERVQVIGNVEYAYLRLLEPEQRIAIFSRLLDYKIPCIIFCRNLDLPEGLVELALEKKVPILRTDKTTSAFTAELIRWLAVELAPRISIHGVLVDVYGEGLLITGESGIGKSEAALELIKRGHRLVADDVVDVRKVSDQTLIGSAPDVTKNMIELRGIGIVDVKAMYGVQSIKATQNIDLVIQLSEWNRQEEYDRLGVEERYTEILGNKVVCHNIPIRPGRNLAMICESAAVNYRQKKMGYNAAQELYNRVTNNLMKKSQ